MSTEAGSLARGMLARVAVIVTATTRGPQRPLSHLETLRHAEWLLRRAEEFLIDAARAEGATWGDVARARGTTRQAERQSAHRRALIAARDPFDRWLQALQDQLADRAKRRAS